MELYIRDEKTNDIETIDSIIVAAFKNVEYSSHTEQFIVRALRERQKLTISLVAVQDGYIVGHVAVSPVNLSSNDSDWYGLGPISVIPNQQRKGIGVALMYAAIDRLQKLNAGGCVLLGDPNYYERFGFQPHPNIVLEGVPAQYFQAISFNNTFPKATVHYDHAFNAVEQ